jgi:hypothetical protein
MPDMKPMTNAGASNRKEPNPVYASAQKFVDSLKKSAVKTEPILNPDRVQRVNMESLLGKWFFVVVQIPLLFLTLYSPPLIFLFLLFFVSFVSFFPFFLTGIAFKICTGGQC